MHYFGIKTRPLNGFEQHIAASVFGFSLPDWDRILISNGLGRNNREWTEATRRGTRLNLFAEQIWVMHIGPAGYAGGAGMLVTLVHELTHVWQGYNSLFFDTYMTRSFLVQTFMSDAYAYQPGEDWDDYNVEQQAKIVEDWYKYGRSQTDPRFRYIKNNIWPGIT